MASTENELETSNTSVSEGQELPPKNDGAPEQNKLLLPERIQPQYQVDDSPTGPALPAQQTIPRQISNEGRQPWKLPPIGLEISFSCEITANNAVLMPIWAETLKANKYFIPYKIDTNTFEIYYLGSTNIFYRLWGRHTETDPPQGPSKSRWAISWRLSVAAANNRSPQSKPYYRI
jgi:hypothetical protein